MRYKWFDQSILTDRLLGMLDKSFFNHHPILLVVTNPRGMILECSPWAEQQLNIQPKTLMQEYFYEDDAVRVVRTLQGCDPIVREPFRLEVREGVIRHMRCTVLMDGNLLTWSFEDVHELTLLREEAKTLQTLPKEYGHEMNNFLTVIGSAAEGIQLDATEPLMKEDAEAILSMTERAAVLTRQFMHLGRKSQLPQAIVNLSERLHAERHRLQRLTNANVNIAIQDKDAHVFASSYLLRNIWMAAIQNFEDKDIMISVSVSHLSYHFSSRILGLPAGIYVIVSIFEQGESWSLDKILNARNVQSREGDALQGAWESLTRCRGGLCEHQDASGARCISLFMPWVRAE